MDLKHFISSLTLKYWLSCGRRKAERKGPMRKKISGSSFDIAGLLGIFLPILEGVSNLYIVFFILLCSESGKTFIVIPHMLHLAMKFEKGMPIETCNLTLFLTITNGCNLFIIHQYSSLLTTRKVTQDSHLGIKGVYTCWQDKWLEAFFFGQFIIDLTVLLKTLHTARANRETRQRNCSQSQYRGSFTLGCFLWIWGLEASIPLQSSTLFASFMSITLGQEPCG